MSISSGGVAQNYVQMPSPLGELTLVGDDRGLQILSWGEPLVNLSARAGELRRDPTQPILREAIRQLEAYFARRLQRFDLPLNPLGTPFQRQVWSALTEIPYGKTASYAQQAQRIGRPGAARAVGAANGRNPIGIIIPCHRVIGSSGHLTGYAGGLDAKRFLLELEGSLLL